MTSRFLISNGAKLLLLLGAVLGPTQAVRTFCLVALVAVFVSDIVAYRREQRERDLDEEESPEHVPLPPAWRQRQDGEHI